MSSVPLVGFTGSRSLPSRFSPLVGAVLQSVVRSGRGVAVGDAAGADAFVRVRAKQCGVQPHVFRPSLYGGRRVPGALAHRSAAMVRAVQQSGGRAGVVGFVSSPCPVHPRSGKLLVPSRSSVRCFGGFGSGTWSTLAFAVALGLSVVVFPCGVSHRAALPSHWGGVWAVTGVGGPWVKARRFVPLQRARVGVAGLVGAAQLAGRDQVLDVRHINVPQFSVALFASHLMISVRPVIAADPRDLLMRVAGRLSGVGGGDHPRAYKLIIGFDFGDALLRVSDDVALHALAIRQAIRESA